MKAVFITFSQGVEHSSFSVCSVYELRKNSIAFVLMNRSNICLEPLAAVNYSFSLLQGFLLKLFLLRDFIFQKTLYEKLQKKLLKLNLKNLKKSKTSKG